MNDSEFELDLDELNSAEDFLDYFGVEYDPAVVHVNRLHILQRFHDYIQGIDDMPDEDETRRVLYTGLLTSAYSDFVQSDALTEKVFKVFRMNEPMTVEVPLADLGLQVPPRAT